MSILLNYLKLPNNKSLLWWLNYYRNHFLITIYEKKKLSNKTDNSWKNTNVKTTYFPKNYPIKGTDNEKLAYFCENTEQKIWKNK